MSVQEKHNSNGKHDSMGEIWQYGEGEKTWQYRENIMVLEKTCQYGENIVVWEKHDYMEENMTVIRQTK